jgi:hypothetical protein
MPRRVFDIYPEYYLLVNDGLKHGRSLLDAANFFALESIGKAAKDEGRALAIRGGPYTGSEEDSLIEYCLSDAALEGEVLLKVLEFALVGQDEVDDLYIRQSVNRGRYFKASARMEHVGIPIKRERFDRYRGARTDIIRKLVQTYDPKHEVWDERLQFHNGRFLEYVTRKKIPWGVYPSGHPILTDEYFKTQAGMYDEIKDIAFLRSALKSVPNRREDLQIGADGFARCILSAFATKTGRTHPKASHFIFGRATWERQRFLGPPKGFAISYIDYIAQELGVAAGLSHDQDFWAAYLSGDLHLTTAKTLGLVPADGRAEDYEDERKAAKQVNFAILYGSSSVGLATKIPIKGYTCASAAALIQAHRLAYPRVHDWIEDQVRAAYWYGELRTRVGWRMRVVSDRVRPNTLRNWLIQATAGEITREAVCRMTESGLSICCPVHDAVLLIAPEDQIERDTDLAIKIMGDASEIILGARLLVETPDSVRYPDTLSEGKVSKVTQFIDPYLGGGV